MEFLRRTRGYNLNDIMSNKSALTRINRIVQVAEGPVIMTTSGGKFSALLPHLVRRATGRDIPLIFVDTRHYTKPTYDMITYLQEQSFDVRVYASNYEQDQLQQDFPDWWNDTADGYSQATFEKVVRMIKHEPLERAIDDIQPEMWLSGLTSFKTAERANKSIIEYNAMEIVKLHPIIDWQQKDVEDYLAWHSLPRNEHHFDISKGMSQKNECGIHTTFGE